MNIDKAKLIEKIKKLLELSTSSNEHEAKSAMDNAQKLMIRYSIAESELSEQELRETKIIQSEYWNTNLGRPGLLPYVPQMINTIGPIFGVYGLTHLKNKTVERMDLIGYPTNIEITRFALDSIITQGLYESKLAYRQYRTTTFGESFWKGFADGLYDKFNSFKEQSKGIVVYDKIKQHVNSLASGTYRAPTANELAQGAGFAAGQKAEIRRAVENTNQGKFLK